MEEPARNEIPVAVERATPVSYFGAKPGSPGRFKRLEVGNIKIRRVQLGAKTEIKDGVLTVNAEELKTLLLQDSRLGKVEIDAANPGESTRIVRVANIYEPRARTGNRKGQFPFPGTLGPTLNAGKGSIVALKGMSVVVCNPSNLWPPTQFWGARPRRLTGASDPGGQGTAHIIQMNGPVEGVCPAPSLACLAVSCYPARAYEYAPQDPEKWPTLDAEIYGAALEVAGLRAAAYLGRAGEDLKPDSKEIYQLPAVSAVQKGLESLPKVAYISSIAHTNCPLPQDFHTNNTPPLLYGGSASGLLAMLIHPNDYIDGAVVHPHDHHNDTAYGIQNDPYIRELYRRHGKDLYFAGVVLTQHLWEASSVNTANQLAVNMVVDILGADGVIIHKPGGGAPHGNTAQMCKMCEEAGVKAVFLRSGQIPIYSNPGPLFGVTDLSVSPTVKLPAAAKVIGFSSEITDPPKSEMYAMLYQPLLDRGGEKYQGVPQWLPLDDPYRGAPPNIRTVTPRTGAERAIDMVLNKIAGKPWRPEVIVQSGIPPAIKAAPGIKDITRAKIAFVTGGGLVKIGEMPFTNSGAIDGRFAMYDLTGLDSLNPKEMEIHHSGYTPNWIKEDPHRLFPLPEIRQLLKEGKFGSIHETLYSWSSLVGQWVGCRKVGEGILPLLKAAGVDAVITDST